MSLWSQCYSLVSLTWGSSQDMFCILCFLVQTYHLYLSVFFFSWIPVFEQFDQGSCFGTVMFETCPTSWIYKFLITISVVSLHMTVSSLTSWRINPVGFSLNLKKKRKRKNLPIFLHVFPSFLPHQECILYASSAPWLPLPSSQTFFNTDIIFIFKISIWAI